MALISCSGVMASPWPMAMLAGTTPRHCSGKGRIPFATPGSSTSLAEPNPQLQRVSYILTFSDRTPI